MNRIIIFLCLLTGYCTTVSGQQSSFDFQFTGITLNGVLDIPENRAPKGIVLIVHGAGQTNAVAQNWHADVRGALAEAGYATYMWDKMGCGASGGTFNYDQTVQSSAAEVIAAIEALKGKQIPGSQAIGLWGISRAGWINPLVINQYPGIKFWISVSGVDANESFGYLLEQNLRLNGLAQDSIDLLVEEWKAGNQITHSGGHYEAYLAATSNLRQNAFLQRFNGGNQVSAAGYYEFQKFFRKQKWDDELGLQVYVEGFDEMLAAVSCPVLAIFGETDMTVDWRQTKALYSREIDPDQLTLATFPGCNHNMFQCQTGGFYEFEDDHLPWNRCEGFLELMVSWLNETVEQQ